MKSLSLKGWLIQFNFVFQSLDIFMELIFTFSMHFKFFGMEYKNLPPPHCFLSSSFFISLDLFL